MTDISEEYKKMLRELNAALQPERQDGEFTINEYAVANDYTRDKARAILEAAERAGKLTKPPKRYINGRPQVVYREA